MWYNRIKATKSFQDQPGKPGIPIHLLGEPQVTILAEQYSFKNQDDKAICSFRYSVFPTQVEAAIYAIEGPSKSRGGRNFYSTIQQHEPRVFLFDYDYEDPSLDSDDKLDEVEPVKLEEIINSIISSIKTCCGLVISRKDLFIFICSRIGKIHFT